MERPPFYVWGPKLLFAIALGLNALVVYGYVNDLQKAPVYACVYGQKAPVIGVPYYEPPTPDDLFYGFPLRCQPINETECYEGTDIVYQGEKIIRSPD